ncbi:MAG: MMPL family transporter, partial [Acidimicrobiia bacterium]
MSRFLYRLGWACAAHRWRTLFAWIAVAIALTGLGQALGGEKKDSFSVPGTESQQAFDLLNGRFPARSGAGVRVVFRGDQPLDSQANAASVAATLERLRALDDVGIVTDPLSPEGQAHLSADGRIGYSEVTYAVSPGDLDSSDVAALEKALAPARDTGLTVAFGGDLAVEEPPSSEALGLGIAVVVLLVAFGSVVAMGLPLLTALIGLGVGMA